MPQQPFTTWTSRSRTRCCLSICVLALALAFGFSASALAGVPFPPFSTCNISVAQFPLRPGCLTLFEPLVVRLTPAGSAATPQFDRVSITVRVRDAVDLPVAGATVRFSEQGTGVARVNIANGGATTAITDASGLATVSLHAASGFGRVALCADGIQLCNLNVRSPDVTKSSSPALCGLGTAASAVSGNDITNPECGYLVQFGSVTLGINDGFDLNCDNNVAGSDINGILGKGGVLQYFGDIGTLGAFNACP